MLNCALGDDITPITHPVRLAIGTTGDAANAFDRICYNKGASWIKTMDNFVGRPVLQKGLQSYIKKFAYKNTTLEDFLACLDEEAKSPGLDALKKSGSNLQKWAESWLLKAGVNSLQVDC